MRRAEEAQRAAEEEQRRKEEAARAREAAATAKPAARGRGVPSSRGGSTRGRGKFLSFIVTQ